MFAKVEQHVDQSVPDLARRREGPRVITATPDGAAAVVRAVEGAGGAAGQALNAAAQARARGGFDHEMKVIGLSREVDDPEAPTVGAGDGCAQRREGGRRPERPHTRLRAESDVDRVARVVGRSCDMRNLTAPHGGLATGAPPTASPGRRQGQQQLSWRGACHLDLALFSARARAELRAISRTPSSGGPRSVCPSCPLRCLLHSCRRRRPARRAPHGGLATGAR